MGGPATPRPAAPVRMTASGPAARHPWPLDHLLLLSSSASFSLLLAHIRVFRPHTRSRPQLRVHSYLRPALPIFHPTTHPLSQLPSHQATSHRPAWPLTHPATQPTSHPASHLAIDKPSQVRATSPGHRSRPQVPTTSPGHRSRPQVSTTGPGHRSRPQVSTTGPGHKSWQQVLDIGPSHRSQPQVPTTITTTAIARTPPAGGPAAHAADPVAAVAAAAC